MSTFLLNITSPDGSMFTDEVISVSARGTEGDLAILAGHIPFITALKECDVVIELSDGTKKTGHTDGGMLTVSNEKTTLLSSSFSWK